MAWPPIYRVFEATSKTGETLEQTHNVKATPAETCYYAVNEAAESVMNVITIQLQDVDGKTTFLAAKSFSKDVEKAVKTDVKACIA